MRQRFYFDLTNGEELISDEEGVEAANFDEAIKEARAALDEMRGIEEATASGNGWKLIIRDEGGMTMSAISLDDGVLQKATTSTLLAQLRAFFQ